MFVLFFKDISLSFVHLTNAFWASSLTGIVWSSRNIAVGKTDEIPALLELTVWETDSKQVNKYKKIVLPRELTQGYVVRVGPLLLWRPLWGGCIYAEAWMTKKSLLCKDGAEPSRQRGQSCKVPRLTVPLYDLLTLSGRLRVGLHDCWMKGECSLFTVYVTGWCHPFQGCGGCARAILNQHLLGDTGCCCSQQLWPSIFW